MENPAYRLAYLLVFLFSAAPILAQEDSVLAEKLNRLNAYPDLIVSNGKIATMDRAMSEVEAMAIRDGRILALGSNDDILFLSGPATQILDAKGKRVLPGLIDSHTHLTYHPAIPNVWEQEFRESLELNTLRAAHNAEAILGMGFTTIGDGGCRGFIGLIWPPCKGRELRIPTTRFSGWASV